MVESFEGRVEAEVDDLRRQLESALADVAACKGDVAQLRDCLAATAQHNAARGAAEAEAQAVRVQMEEMGREVGLLKEGLGGAVARGQV
jgi:hypothetical protein